MVRGLAAPRDLRARAWRGMLQGWPRARRVSSSIGWGSNGSAAASPIWVCIGTGSIQLSFARVVLEPAHGVLVTSATLTDAAPKRPRAGSMRAPQPAPATCRCRRCAHAFRLAVRLCHANQSLLITDVDRDDAAAVSAAFRVLFSRPAVARLEFSRRSQRAENGDGRIAQALEERMPI